MSTYLDDPRITAYVLGELSESERTEFEAALRDAPELAAAVAATNETAALLRRELAIECETARPLPAAGLAQAVLGAVESAGPVVASPAIQVARPLRTTGLLRRRYLLPAVTAVAAAGVAAALWLPSVQTVTERSKSMARKSGEEVNFKRRSILNSPVAMPTATSPSKDRADAPATPPAAQSSQVLGRALQEPPAPKSAAPAPPYLVREAIPLGEAPAVGYPERQYWHATARRNVAAQIKGATPASSYSSDLGLGFGTVAEGERGVSNQPARESYYVGALKLSPDADGVDKLERFRASPPRPDVAPLDHEHNTEAYARINDNPFHAVADQPLSTFSVDVDTASYSNMRRFLTSGMLPPPDAVRIEELVNYFDYHYEGPTGEHPFATHMEVTACPWNAEHRLVRIGLQGREMPAAERPAANLVFLLDVSGSMDAPNKMPLMKQSLRMLVERLTERDRVAIVVYAGASGLVLPSTTANNQDTILSAIEQLQPGGSTNGASGIQLAYETAVQHLDKEGINRVILCTDGDFNVGVTNEGELTRLIEEKAKTGVFLSVMGFGMGNFKDSMLEKLADCGNGNYGYIDTQNEARKLFGEQLEGTLATIAKDVKIQVEFNPTHVGGYRLLGYENRKLAAEDFNNDQKDAGEIGAGHTVTALYEIVPVGKPIQPGVDPLKYQPTRPAPDAAASDELLTLKLRYKLPQADTSKLIEQPLKDDGRGFAQASKDTQFAAAVALFGMLLRHSEHVGAGNYGAVLEIAESASGDDVTGYRREFVELVKKARQYAGQ